MTKDLICIFRHCLIESLFIDTANGIVVARSYPKFFNVNERPETRFGMLQYKLKFPVTVYVKENGFLGMVSYNPAKI